MKNINLSIYEALEMLLKINTAVRALDEKEKQK